MVVRNYLFHRVGTTGEPWGLPMEPKVFERCIRYISRRFNVVTIEELLLDGLIDQPSGPKFATITFDDGFRDNLEVAAPILDKFNVKATFYMVTDCIDSGRPTWTHDYPNAFLNTRKLSLTLTIPSLGYQNETLTFSNKKERVAFGDGLYRKMRHIPFHETTEAMNQILSQFDDVPRIEGVMMNWDEVRQLQAAGFTIGSHSKSHPYLGNIEDKAHLHRELNDSYAKIKAECGVAPRSISYPVSHYSDQVKTMAQAAGYGLGLAVEQRFFHPGQNDNFSIPRMDIYPGSGWAKTFLRLNGKMETVKRLFGR